MMEEILARCADAADKLDAESDRFDDLRDLRSRLPQVLAELPGQIEAQQARIGRRSARPCSDCSSSTRRPRWPQ